MIMHFNNVWDFFDFFSRWIASGFILYSSVEINDTVRHDDASEPWTGAFNGFESLDYLETDFIVVVTCRFLRSFRPRC